MAHKKSHTEAMTTDLRFPYSLQYLNPSTDFPSNQCTKVCIFRLDLLMRCNSECMWFPLKSLLLAWNAFGQNRLRSKILLPKNNCVSHNHYKHKKINHLHNLAQCNICLLFGAVVIHCNTFHSGTHWKLLPKKKVSFFNIKQYFQSLV